MHFSKTNWADGDLITLWLRKSHEKAIISECLWPHDCSALQGKYWGEEKWAKHVEGHFFLLPKSRTKECEDGLSSAEPSNVQPSELNGKSYEFAEWELLAKTCGNVVAQVLVSEILMVLKAWQGGGQGGKRIRCDLCDQHKRRKCQKQQLSWTSNWSWMQILQWKKRVLSQGFWVLTTELQEQQPDSVYLHQSP